MQREYTNRVLYACILKFHRTVFSKHPVLPGPKSKFIPVVIQCCSKSDPKTILLQLKDAIEQVTKDNVGAVPIHSNHCFSKDLSLVTNPPARKAALEKLWNKVRRNIFAISITRFFYTIRKYLLFFTITINKCQIKKPRHQEG